MLSPSPIYVPASCRRVSEAETPRLVARRLIARSILRTSVEIAALGLFVGALVAWSAVAGA